MKTIALLNQKGGVAKTTSCINIGAALATRGKKVLLLDLDPQAHLTYSLGIAAHEQQRTIYEVLRGDFPLYDAVMERGGMSMVPASLNLSAAEIELSGKPGREFLLKESFTKVEGYDFILLDCPPSLGLLTLNALTAANEVFIPLQTEFLAMQGMSTLIQTIELVKKRLNPALEVAGIIGTRFDSRKNLNQEVVKKIREHFGDKVFKTLIRDNVAVAEAPSFGQTIFEYRPDSNGATDYLALTDEILTRIEGGIYAQV
jgi:chromosome partitioning protein